MVGQGFTEWRNVAKARGTLSRTFPAPSARGRRVLWHLRCRSRLLQYEGVPVQCTVVPFPISCCHLNGKRVLAMKSSQKFILSTKRFYWARRQDPLGWHAMGKWRRAVMHAAEVARYAVTGRANLGFCPVCEQTTTFIERSAWLRDNYLCAKCRSIYGRLLMQVLS